jgi:serine/threonine protein kinase/DNA-directed RNA polymerase subunit RPC12/RpoP
MISFKCSTCGQQITVADDQIGRTTVCVRCRQPITIREPSPEPARVGPDVAGGTPTPINEPVPSWSEPTRDFSGAPESATLPPRDARSPTPVQVPAGLSPEYYDFLAPAQDPGELGRLGPYRVLGVLGTGGMGVVFRAQDPQLERPVALKVMLPALAASPSAKQRFLREARAAAALDDDHIVQIYQVGEDRGIPFLAMQFLKGETLDALLRRVNHLPVPEAVRIGREIAEGLAAAHAQGLIHRDIKPANIWLEAAQAGSDRAGRVKILDFGLARAVVPDQQITQSGAILGTPAYMSPEQSGGKTIDHRADLFSLGCVLYQTATGVSPFQSSDPVTTLIAVATEQPRPLREIDPAIPAELDDLVMRLLAKDPASRPGSAGYVVEALRSIEKSTPASGVAAAINEVIGHSILRSIEWLRSRRSGKSATPPPASRRIPTASLPPLTVAPVYTTPIPDYSRPRRSRFKRFVLIFVAIFILYQIVRSRDRGPVTITVSDDGKVHVSKGKDGRLDPAVPSPAMKVAKAALIEKYGPTDWVLKSSELRGPKAAVFSGELGEGHEAKKFRVYVKIPDKKTRWQLDHIELDSKDASGEGSDDS